MEILPLYQVDAFTNRVFGGNPAAVCILENDIAETVMQYIATENNLAETAFILKKDTFYQIRWFTPTVEINLCGHATLAAAHVLFHYNFEEGNIIQFQSHLSGQLTVTKGGNDCLTLDFPADCCQEVTYEIGLITGLSIAPQKIFKGKTDYLMLFQNEQQIAQLNVNFSVLNQLKCRGVIATARGEDVDFVSRFFAPQSGIDEDPVTGSAHTTLTPFWAKYLHKKKMTAKQLSKRIGYLWVEDCGSRVKISGHAVIYSKGEIYI